MNKSIGQEKLISEIFELFQIGNYSRAKVGTVKLENYSPKEGNGGEGA